MWSKSYSTTVTDLTAEKVWSVWTDVDRWKDWQDDIEFANLEGSFVEAGIIQFRPKGGPTLKLELTEVVPKRKFVDLTRFPLAKMHDSHELISHADGLEIRTTISLSGPLAFVWRKIVAEGIVSGLEAQTAKLIERCRLA
jgi:hypothetical protein